MQVYNPVTRWLDNTSLESQLSNSKLVGWNPAYGHLKDWNWSLDYILVWMWMYAYYKIAFAEIAV